MKRTLSIILGGVGLLAVIFGITTAVEYNALSKNHEDIAYRKSEIVNSLETRDSTLEQLASAVDAAIDLETSIYEMITDAREAYAAAAAGQDYKAIIEADTLSSLAISELLAVIEDNPDVQSIEVIEGYMASIESLENTLKVARRNYNESVRDYNTSVRLFPKNIFASMFGFDTQMPYWSPNPDTGEGDIEVSGISYSGADAS